MTFNQLISNIELDLTKMSWGELKRLDQELDESSAERVAHLMRTNVGIDAVDELALAARVGDEIRRRAKIANAV